VKKKKWVVMGGGGRCILETHKTIDQRRRKFTFGLSQPLQGGIIQKRGRKNCNMKSADIEGEVEQDVLRDLEIRGAPLERCTERR